MPLTLTSFELSLVAWSHQSSRCERVVRQSSLTRPAQASVRHITACGHSVLYGVTMLGDELELLINWRADGDQITSVGSICVFERLAQKADAPQSTALRQRGVLLDHEGQIMSASASYAVLLASIRHCEWRFPARQYLSSRHLSQRPMPANASVLIQHQDRRADKKETA